VIPLARSQKPLPGCGREYIHGLEEVAVQGNGSASPNQLK